MAAFSDLFDPRRERRSAPRQELAATAVVSEWPVVRLVEISSGGFRASAGANVRPGEMIRIEIPALGTKSARVKWIDGPVFGAEFLSPADLRLLFLCGPVECGEVPNAGDKSRGRALELGQGLEVAA